MPDNTDLTQAIETAAQKPAEVEVDGQRVKNRSLKELIEADQHLASKQVQNPSRKLRFAKFIPPGTV